MQDVQLKIARIEYQGTTDDSRTTIRILPEMEDLREEEYLPLWPSFFKDEVFVGKRGDLVWVICNSDFTTGFILGQAAEFTWTGSYRNSSITDAKFERMSSIYVNAKGKVLNYVDLKITYWDAESLHMIERRTGSHIIVFTSGVIHSITPNDIFMSVGGSKFHMKENEVVIESETVRLVGNIRLGNNLQGKVLVTQGSGSKNALVSGNVWA
jgi:hypothetical protein